MVYIHNLTSDVDVFNPIWLNFPHFSRVTSAMEDELPVFGQVVPCQCQRLGRLSRCREVSWRLRGECHAVGPGGQRKWGVLGGFFKAKMGEEDFS